MKRGSETMTRSRTLAGWLLGLAGALAGTAGTQAEEPAGASSPRSDVIVVVGAAGADEFREPFRTWADRWKKAAEAADVPATVIGLEEEPAAGGGEKAAPDREQLKQELAKQTGPAEGRLWVVFIGHGTFDGKTARFNLRGEDVTPADLRGWLAKVERPVAVLDCTSCSAPFLTELSAPNRVVLTATRSGTEFNFARFGDALSTGVTAPEADLDKDEQSSLLEAYLFAAARTAEYYSSQTRLQTEHPLLDDNGDKQGTPPDFFQGLKATKAAKSGAAADGGLAARFVLVPSERESQLPAEAKLRRDALELELARVRSRKDSLGDEAYWKEVERIVTAIARLYGENEKP